MFQVPSGHRCVNCRFWIAKPTPKYQGHHTCDLSGKTRVACLAGCQYWENLPKTLAAAKKLVIRA